MGEYVEMFKELMKKFEDNNIYIFKEGDIYVSPSFNEEPSYTTYIDDNTSEDSVMKKLIGVPTLDNLESRGYNILKY